MHAPKAADLDCQAAPLRGGLIYPRIDGVSYAAECTGYEAVVIVINILIIAVL